MKRFKNSKGITLIALIVTIIVIAIMSGAIIATLTSDNGVIRQTNTAKAKQIEATAREQVKLACSTMRLAIAEASSKDNSYKAYNHVEEIQNVLLKVIKDDTKELKQEGWIEGIYDISTGTFEIIYSGDDYRNACNYQNARITYTIKLGQKSIDFIEKIDGIKDSAGNDIEIDVGNSAGSDSGESDSSGIYLADQVNVGDYVDLGIEYTNLGSYYYTGNYGSKYTENDYTSTNGPTGWRVLNVTGTGSDGIVTIVSAGTPLKINYDYAVTDAQTMIDTTLSNLNRDITIVNNQEVGFTGNGFKNNNLSSMWSSNNNIDASTIHTMTEDELVYTYEAVDFDRIGLAYVLANSFGENKEYLGFYSENGSRNAYTKLESGIRVVLSLKKGVEVANTNIGNGESKETAYTLATYNGNTSSGGSTSVVAEKLATPVISITGTNLKIEKVAKATNYAIYVNGTLKQTIKVNTLDLSTLALDVGNHEIKVKAKAYGYQDSDFSIASTYNQTTVAAGQYLVDAVEIGDYVEIGIDYTNQLPYYADYVNGKYDSKGLKGWRVLRKYGSGSTGTVTLVSAGVPLSYFYGSESIYNPVYPISEHFDNLNTTLSQGIQLSESGYISSGFENNTMDLASIWSKNDKIDAATVHAMDSNEVVEAYSEITGTSYVLTEDTSSIDTMRTEYMLKVNPNMSVKSYDLLGIGSCYWLCNIKSGTNIIGMWEIDLSGTVNTYYSLINGIRPVFELKPGVTISNTNTGTGINSIAAYKLAD